MKLLYIGDSYNEDDRELDRLSRMPALVGHKILTSFSKRENATEVAMLARKHEVDGVICSQQSLL